MKEIFIPFADDYRADVNIRNIVLFSTGVNSRDILVSFLEKLLDGKISYFSNIDTILTFYIREKNIRAIVMPILDSIDIKQNKNNIVRVLRYYGTVKCITILSNWNIKMTSDLNIHYIKEILSIFPLSIGRNIILIYTHESFISSLESSESKKNHQKFYEHNFEEIVDREGLTVSNGRDFSSIKNRIMEICDTVEDIKQFSYIEEDRELLNLLNESLSKLYDSKEEKCKGILEDEYIGDICENKIDSCPLNNNNFYTSHVGYYTNEALSEIELSPKKKLSLLEENIIFNDSRGRTSIKIDSLDNIDYILGNLTYNPHIGFVPFEIK